MLEELMKPINFAISPYITMIYLFCFLLLGISFITSNRRVATPFARFFDLTNKKLIHSNFISRLIEIIVGLIGLVLFAIFSIDALEPNIWITNHEIDYSRLCTTSLMVLIAIVAFIIYNILIAKIVQYIFTLNRHSIGNYSSFALDSLTDLGIMLFFVSFLETYTTFSNNLILLWLGTVFILLFMVKIVVGAFQYFSFRSNGLYRFFLYLCILEILPILVLIKYISVLII